MSTRVPILKRTYGDPIDKRRYKIRLVGIVGTYTFIYSAVSSTYTMPYSKLVMVHL